MSDKKFRQGFIGAPGAAQGREISNSFPCSLAPGEGRAGSLYGGRVSMCPGVRPEVWLRWSAHPFGGVECRGHVQYPAFAPDSSEVAVGFFWSLCILSIICPNSACMQLFLIHYSFFVVCCLRRHLSRCQHCSKGSQVPGPSLSQGD